VVSVDGGLKRQFGSICVLLPKKLLSIAFSPARSTNEGCAASRVWGAELVTEYLCNVVCVNISLQAQLMAEEMYQEGHRDEECEQVGSGLKHLYSRQTEDARQCQGEGHEAHSLTAACEERGGYSQTDALENLIHICGKCHEWHDCAGKI